LHAGLYKALLRVGEPRRNESHWFFTLPPFLLSDCRWWQALRRRALRRGHIINTLRDIGVVLRRGAGILSQSDHGLAEGRLLLNFYLRYPDGLEGRRTAARSALRRVAETPMRLWGDIYTVRDHHTLGKEVSDSAAHTLFPPVEVDLAAHKLLP
jgi:hypothetical protein